MPPDATKVTGPGSSSGTCEDGSATKHHTDRRNRTRPPERADVLATFLFDRERILGAVRLHRDPEIAAALLVASMGRVEARRWLLAVMERTAEIVR